MSSTLSSSPTMIRYASFTNQQTSARIYVIVPERGDGYLQINEDLTISVIGPTGAELIPTFVSKDPVRNGNTILFSCGQTLIFNDTTACSIAWIALQYITSNTSNEILSIPTLYNIPSLHLFMTSVHPIMYSIIAKSVARLEFMYSLYEVFVNAELGQHFDILCCIRNIVLVFFHLNSPSLLSLLLAPNHIDHTISYLEYDSVKKEFHTTNRCFLKHTTFHNVLDMDNEHFKDLVETNYKINYIQKVIFHCMIPQHIILNIQQIIFDNNCSIMQILLGDKKFHSKIIRAIIPIMISVNGNLVHSSEPNESGLCFLKNLLSLSMPESYMRRLIRKLISAHLFEILDHIIITSHTDSNIYHLILDIWSKLYIIATENATEYLFSPNSRIIQHITSHLTNTSAPSPHIDQMIEFLLEIVPSYNPLLQKDIYSQYIPLSNIVRSILSTQHAIHDTVKQRKICVFLERLSHKRPDLCRDHIDGYLNAFIEWTNYSITTTNLSVEQKAVRLDISRLLCSVMETNDKRVVQAVSKRSGLMKSIALMMLMNGSKEGMLSSTLQRMTCFLSEQWVTSLFYKNENIQTIPPIEKINGIYQLFVALRLAMETICKKWNIHNVVSLQHTTPLITFEKQPEDTKKEVDVSRKLAIQTMSHHVQHMIRRNQTQAMSRWKRFVIDSKQNVQPDQFIVDALFVVVSQRDQERRRAMAFVLRKCILPILKGITLRKPFQEWRYIVQQERIKSEEIKKHLTQYTPPTAVESQLDSVRSYDSIDSSSTFNSGSTHNVIQLFRQSSSIGEEIGSCLQPRKKDDDTFFFIRAIKNDGAYLLPSTDISSRTQSA